jgi:ferredoxin/flavodoxin---NADP+ reductase
MNCSLNLQHPALGLIQKRKHIVVKKLLDLFYYLHLAYLKESSDNMVSPVLNKITQIRFLTENTFVLRFDRGGLEFRAGQHIIVGLQGELNQREYSIYSGEQDPYLEILVREVPDGSVSLQLRECKPGDELQVNGPFGSFGIERFDRFSKKHVFIASGTGISPFHSFIRSYPGIDYLLIHGVRYMNEAYERSDYDSNRYILCTSKEGSGLQKGRVTGFIPTYNFVPGSLYYLCGNSNMIYEVDHLLRDKMVPAENIITEVYF